MTRQKHGHYDASKGLPDNRGQAQGSGLYVWLQNEVAQHFGSDLVEAAQASGDQRYHWLIEQLEAMHSEEADELVKEFHRRRKGNAAVQRQLDRERRLTGLQSQLETEQSEQRRAWLVKEIAKVQRQIDKAK